VASERWSLKRVPALAQFLCSLLYAWFALAQGLGEWGGRVRFFNFVVASLVSFIASRAIWAEKVWAPHLALVIAIAVGVTPLGSLAAALDGTYGGPSIFVAFLGVTTQMVVVVWALSAIWPKRDGEAVSPSAVDR
jgi:hypothetical protein